MWRVIRGCLQRLFGRVLPTSSGDSLRARLACVCCPQQGRHYDMTAWSNASRFTKPVAQREALRDPSAKVWLVPL
jgi:hypothetical protein